MSFLTGRHWLCVLCDGPLIFLLVVLFQAPPLDLVLVEPPLELLLIVELIIRVAFICSSLVLAVPPLEWLPLF